jgi:hypothetical protein
MGRLVVGGTLKKGNQYLIVKEQKALLKVKSTIIFGLDWRWV